jgi:hypothetical protein
MRWVRRAGELEWHGRATRTRIDGALGPIVGTIIAQTHRIWGRTEPIAASLFHVKRSLLAGNGIHTFILFAIACNRNCNLKHLVLFSILTLLFCLGHVRRNVFISSCLSCSSHSLPVLHRWIPKISAAPNPWGRPEAWWWDCRECCASALLAKSNVRKGALVIILTLSLIFFCLGKSSELFLHLHPSLLDLALGFFSRTKVSPQDGRHLQRSREHLYPAQWCQHHSFIPL